MVRSFYVILSGCLIWLATSVAQGQTVQLPTLNWFSVNTSVMVPDRGGAHLGGVSRSALGSKQSGRGRLFGNRASGGSTGTSSTSVHVTIIDHSELDRAVLAEARRRRSASYGAFSPATTRLSNELAANASSATAEGQGLMSVAEIRRLNAHRKSASHEEARRLASQGWEAEQKGSHGAAKIFYQMAFRRAEGELQQQIGTRLKNLLQREPAER